nr:WhiB family transcriptional regulator [Rhodococcus jostii]
MEAPAPGQLRAACRGMNSSIFFHPDRERGQARERRIRVAKFICHQCPVIDACREHALTVVEPYGIWRGMSEADRSNSPNSGNPN